jgi:hypothetical protein
MSTPWPQRGQAFDTYMVKRTFSGLRIRRLGRSLFISPTVGPKSYSDAFSRNHPRLVHIPVTPEPQPSIELPWLRIDLEIRRPDTQARSHGSSTEGAPG